MQRSSGQSGNWRGQVTMLAGVALSIGLHAGVAAWWAKHATTVSSIAPPQAAVTVDLLAPPPPVVPSSAVPPAAVPPPAVQPVIQPDEMAAQYREVKKAPPGKKPPVRPSVTATGKPVAVPAAAVASAPPAVATAPVAGPPVALTAARYDAGYLNNPPPAYPPLSRRLGEQGLVLLRVQVSAEGKALAVELKHSSGFARLDDAATRAAAAWRFVPARQGEVAVVSWVEVPVRFSLQK